MAIPVLYLPRNFARVPSLSFIPEFIENPTIPSFRTDLEYAKIISIETPCKKNPKSPAPVVAVSDAVERVFCKSHYMLSVNSWLYPLCFLLLHLTPFR